MVALFLGRILSDALWRRASCSSWRERRLRSSVISGAPYLLCEVAANSGVEAIHRWHDPAGFTILGHLAFLALGIEPVVKTSARFPNLRRSKSAGHNVGRGWLPAALILWLVLTEIATAACGIPFRGEKVTTAPWSVDLAERRAGLSPRADPRAAKLYCVTTKAARRPGVPPTIAAG